MINSEVTIVIPTFNRADLVTKAIDCSLAQTYSCKIIVCDHGSTDNTPEVMQRYIDKITYIRREKDFGPHFCWLEGVLNADTKYVHLQFDDDLIVPTFIEKTLSLMSDDVGVVITDASVLDVKQQLTTNKSIFNHSKFYKTGVLSNAILEKMLLQGLMFSPAVCLYRKKDVIDALYQGDLPIQLGSTYHGVGPDYFMTFLTILRYKNFGIVVEPLAVFGSHEQSITYDASLDEVKNQLLSDGYTAVKKYFIILRLFSCGVKFDSVLLTYFYKSILVGNLKKIVKRALAKIGFYKGKY